MSFLAVWYHTKLPLDITNILINDLQQFDSAFDSATISSDNVVDKKIRDSKTSWIFTSHWIGPFLWYYIERANRENFQYDLVTIDGEAIQYTEYGPGQFYNWHVDAGLDTFYSPQEIISAKPDNMQKQAQDKILLESELIRKLSFSLQLSDPEDYEGGELQFIDNNRNTFFAPKEKGTLILFDSRVSHRVRKVKSGKRKSLVGWVIGPRWK